MNEPKVSVTRRGAERLEKGHLWIYRSDVEKAPASLAGGEVVAVVDGRGRFLARGKRIFLKAPIHHHFEMKGWEEPKVVVRLWIIAILLALLSLSTLKLR